MMRARSSRSWSVRRMPSYGEAVTGKKMIKTAMATLEAMP